MPSPSFSVSTEIRAEPDMVFAYVSDLSKHGEWAGNELRVEPVDDAPIGVGKRYRSYAQARGREFHAELQVTEYAPPGAFAFVGADETGRFKHRFTFEKVGDRTRVSRTVDFELSLAQYMFYLIALNRVRLPAAQVALSRLKEQIEEHSH
jgi:uncharacterized protein YndB with AHSA1/START domain